MFDKCSHLVLHRSYTVERRHAKKGTWVAVSNFVQGSPYTVSKLMEGTEYDFRVTAENANGTSAPLETEKPTLAKNPYG